LLFDPSKTRSLVWVGFRQGERGEGRGERGEGEGRGARGQGRRGQRGGREWDKEGIKEGEGERGRA
jgi:hypothetical protein